MKTALITGANKGIGFEICKQLSEKGYLVYLTARDPQKGKDSTKQLLKLGLNIRFLQLDVSSQTSINSAAKEFKKLSENLEILINNAAILIDKGNVLSISSDVLKLTLETNTLGVYSVIQAFLPLLKRGSRIINISSGLGSLKEMNGYAPAYSISKAGLNAITKIFASELISRGIAVNAVSPGWVRTDMGGSSAPRSVEKGAETPVWLATTADSNITGKIFRDKKEIDW